LEAAFPQKVDTTVIVIDADNGDKADAAAASLAEKLQAMPGKFTFVSRPDALPFFRQNGLLYLSKDDLAATLDQIAQAQPLIATLISDPSLRGFFGTIGMMMQGVQAGAADPAVQPADDQVGPAVAVVIDEVDGRPRADVDIGLVAAGVGDGTSIVLLTWIYPSAMLEYSSSVNGPWTALPAAGSPYGVDHSLDDPRTLSTGDAGVGDQ